MRLIILDRDGVINEDSDAYIKSPEEWVPIPGSVEGIARLTNAGYWVAVVTNQSGLARGLFDIETLTRIHERMQRVVKEAGGSIEAIFFCPHGPQDNCRCRKPRPGLFQDLAERLRIDLGNVPAVGDSVRDVEAARAAGARPLLVRTGKGAGVKGDDPILVDVPVFDDLAAAVETLLNEDAQSGSSGIR